MKKKKNNIYWWLWLCQKLRDIERKALEKDGSEEALQFLKEEDEKFKQLEELDDDEEDEG